MIKEWHGGESSRQPRVKDKGKGVTKEKAGWFIRILMLGGKKRKGGPMGGTTKVTKRGGRRKGVCSGSS